MNDNEEFLCLIYSIHSSIRRNLVFLRMSRKYPSRIACHCIWLSPIIRAEGNADSLRMVWAASLQRVDKYSNCFRCTLARFLNWTYHLRYDAVIHDHKSSMTKRAPLMHIQRGRSMRSALANLFKRQLWIIEINISDEQFSNQVKKNTSQWKRCHHRANCKIRESFSVFVEHQSTNSEKLVDFQAISKFTLENIPFGCWLIHNSLAAFYNSCNFNGWIFFEL